MSVRSSMAALLAPMILAVSLSHAASSSPAPDPGPAVINLKMGVMLLPFTHKEHQIALKNECYHCHAKQIGKIEGWGKETAHRICIACHDLDGKGPTQCHECHGKSIK